MAACRSSASCSDIAQYDFHGSCSGAYRLAEALGEGGILSTGGRHVQCKPCATAEERRRREQRGAQHAQHAKLAKKCTRCNEEKSVDQFCRNSRSFDGRYSQCRTCVADKVSSWPTKPDSLFWESLSADSCVAVNASGAHDNHHSGLDAA